MTTEAPEGGSGSAPGSPLSSAQRRALAALAIPTFGLALASTTVTTYLPVLLHEISGPLVTGAIIGLEGVLGIFVPPLVGSRSDNLRTRFGRRLPFLVAATPVAAIALVLMPAVGSALALALLVALFFGAYFTYYTPYRAVYPDVVPDDLRGRSQGAQKTAREVGLGAALVGGGLLLGLWKPLPFLIAALLLSASTLAFLRWADTSADAAEDGGDAGDGGGPSAAIASVVAVVREDVRLRWLLVGNAFWEGTLAALKTFVVLFITVGLGRSAALASAVLAIVAVVAVVAGLAAGVLADRYGHLRLMKGATWVYALGLLGPFFVHTTWVIGIVPVVAFAAVVVMTLPFSMMMGMLEGQRHGAASGVFDVSRGLGTLAGPVLAGVAIHFMGPVLESTEGYAAMFLVASALTFASLPCLYALGRAAR